MSGFAKIKHQTRGKWNLSSFEKRKVQTYIYIRHVGCERLLVPLKGLLIFFMFSIEGRLKVRLNFHKQ
jgi:hypothetical protein